MRRIVAIALIAVALAGCDAVTTVTDGFKHAKAVETDLAESTGTKPRVGFNWTNGRLTSVSVHFAGLYESKPLPELAALARTAIAKEFKRTPETLVIAFALDPNAKPDAVGAQAAR